MTLVQTLKACAPGGESPLAFGPFVSMLQPHSLQFQQKEGNIFKGFSLPEAAGIISHLLNFVEASLLPRCKNTSRGYLWHTVKESL